MVQPDVEIDDGTGRIIISSEEGETDGIFYSKIKKKKLLFIIKQIMRRLWQLLVWQINQGLNVTIFFKNMN